LVIASIVDRVSFNKQCLQLDSATRDDLTTRLDYYQVNVDISMLYKALSFFTVVDNKVNVKVTKIYTAAVGMDLFGMLLYINIQ
jgi:hypothetical protein